MSVQAHKHDKTKRSRPAEEESASSADRPGIEDEERSVRPRRDPASSTAASFHPAGSRLLLLRLAVVERQLIMQGLDLSSLARLASTCRQMRAEALHKEAGKFIPEPPGEMRDVDEPCDAVASPLFRMHAPVCLSFHSIHRREQQEELMTQASQFGRIAELCNLPRKWTEAQVLQLLAQPWIQSVTHVDLDLGMWMRAAGKRAVVSSSVWLRPAVQHALFALPRLSSLQLEFEEGARECALLDSALSVASKLTSAVIVNPNRSEDLRALRVLPALQSLRLDAGAATINAITWCLPSTLTSLTLSSFGLDPATTRSALKTLLSRLPQLQSLRAELMEIAPMLQGLLDAGVGALPHLRRVEFQIMASDYYVSGLLRRFLHKFSQPLVRIELDIPLSPDEDDWEKMWELIKQFASHPRVQLDFGESPGVHASDDELESDVELDTHPHEPAERS